MDDLSDFRERERGGRARAKELRAEKARRAGAEPGEIFYFLVLTLTLIVKMFRGSIIALIALFVSNNYTV